MKLTNVIKLVIRLIYDQVLNCIRYDLHCLDPPIVTSGMLDKYGLDNYAKKLSFWKTVETIVSKYNGIILFKGKFGLFKLVLNHNVEEVHRIEGSDVYIDSLDCNYVKCTITPRSHTLRIYLEGVYGERVILRMNIITLLKIAIAENPYFRECLDEFVADPLEYKAIMRISNCALSIITKHKNIYDILFNKHARDITDILKYSSILKKYIEQLNITKDGNNK